MTVKENTQSKKNAAFMICTRKCAFEALFFEIPIFIFIEQVKIRLKKKHNLFLL